MSKQAEILKVWNDCKRPRRDVKMTYEIGNALTEQLEHHTVEEMCSAIRNYWMILLNRDYLWSHRWDILQFFTRHQLPFTKIAQLQWLRFTANLFEDEDFLTTEGKHHKRDKEKRQQSNIPIKMKSVPAAHITRREFGLRRNKQIEELIK